MKTILKLFSRGGVVAVVFGVLGSAVFPAPIFAQTPPPVTSLATVNIAGFVTAVDANNSSLSVQVRWLYGGVYGRSESASSTGQPVGIPVASSFCPGKVITVRIPSTTKLISFSGTPMTLAQVQAGALFNGTATWQNGVISANEIRFTGSEKPTTPRPSGGDGGGSTPVQWGTLPPIAPQGYGSVNINGTVKNVNPGNNAFSAEISWFYGGVANQSQTFMFPVASRLCPGTIVTFNIVSSTSLVSEGAQITLAQVPVGGVFTGTVGWMNGAFTANVIRFATNTEKTNTPPPTIPPPPASTSTPPNQSSTQPASSQPGVPFLRSQSIPPAQCGAWRAFFGLCQPGSSNPVSPTPGNQPTQVQPITAPAPQAAACGFWSRLFGRC